MGKGKVIQQGNTHGKLSLGQGCKTETDLTVTAVPERPEIPNSIIYEISLIPAGVELLCSLSCTVQHVTTGLRSKMCVEDLLKWSQFAAKQLIRHIFPARYVFNAI